MYAKVRKIRESMQKYTKERMQKDEKELTVSAKVCKSQRTYRGQFQQRSMSNFLARRSWKWEETDDLTVFLCFWDLQVKKLLVKCWWNWPLVVLFFSGSLSANLLLHGLLKRTKLWYSQSLFQNALLVLLSDFISYLCCSKIQKNNQNLKKLPFLRWGMSKSLS